jgi:phosphoribosylamine--glycine ligase
VLYAGLMLTADGPRVLEYNVRFGDPETQVVLPRLADDPVALLRAVAEGRLRAVGSPRVRPEASVCVVVAAPGYPSGVRVGAPISGLGRDGQLAEPVEGVTVFHAGTGRQPRADGAPGPYLTAGGRVLGVSALGPTLAEARRRAYAGVAAVGFEGAQYRTDIADAAATADALTRQTAPAGQPATGGAP